MSTGTVVPSVEPRTRVHPRTKWLVSVALLAVLPAVVIAVLFIAAVQEGTVAMDFRQFYRGAETILSGVTPYPESSGRLEPWGGPYPYPPLPALLATPLTVISLQSAGLFVMAVLVVVALLIPWVLEVRDWRCYGLMLLWPPVISAIQTANLTLWLALAAAVAWRYRDRLLPAAAPVGLTLAAKFFLWPIVVWLAATRRFASAALAFAVGVATLLASWAVIRFDSILQYPTILRRLERTVGEDSYTAYVAGLDLGLPSPVARGLWLGIGLCLLALIVGLARRDDERSAFIVGIAASLALTPIVWLHYFALLLVPVALAQPMLGLLWFVPLGMVLTPGSGHPTPFQTAWTLGVAALVFTLALRTTLRKHASRAEQGVLVAVGEV